MLVCNVSLLRRRAAIAADVAEVTLAVDALATGNVVFATLVDDPASVNDRVDAYLGEIMLEAANASSIVNAGLIYKVAVDEAASASSVLTGGRLYTVAVAETATASDALTASKLDVLVATVAETTAAADEPDAAIVSGAPKSAMLIHAAVNYTTPRQANVNGVMTNL